jgi:DNA-binding NarL/FixJ family response regulator
MSGSAIGGETDLTKRERQIVALYRLGAHSKLIAFELGLADATVRVLLSRAARRLGVARPRALRSTREA